MSTIEKFALIPYNRYLELIKQTNHPHTPPHSKRSLGLHEGGVKSISTHTSNSAEVGRGDSVSSKPPPPGLPSFSGESYKEDVLIGDQEGDDGEGEEGNVGVGEERNAWVKHWQSLH
jgi:hypothetical protein